MVEFVNHPSHFIDAGVGVARDRSPAGLPREVFDTLVRVLGHHHHVVHAPEALARHAIGQYTHGHAPNLALGLAHLVPPAIAEHLAALPDPSIAFKSIHDIAPHFAVNPHDAEAIMAHAQAAAGVSLPPEHVAALVQGVQTAVQAQAEHAAAMRVAQQAHLAPRIDAAEPRAQIAVQVSPDGQTILVLVLARDLSNLTQSWTPNTGLPSGGLTTGTFTLTASHGGQTLTTAPLRFDADPAASTESPTSGSRAT